MTKQEKVWHDIPGFHYQISENCLVRNKRTGNILKVGNYGRQKLTVRIEKEDGRRIAVSLGRLLFAALNQIELDKITRKFVIKFKGDRPCRENLTVMEQEDFASQLKRMSLGKRKQDNRQFYEQMERFAHCAAAKDAQGLFLSIQAFHSEIIRIIRCHVFSEENIRKTYDLYVTWLVDGILNGRLRVFNVVTYTSSVFRHRCKRRKVIDLSDRAQECKVSFWEDKVYG